MGATDKDPVFPAAAADRRLNLVMGKEKWVEWQKRNISHSSSS